MKPPETWTSEIATEWIDDKIEQKRKIFSRTDQAQLVSFRNWCADWDWAHRSDVYTHALHSYPAKLLAYVPIAFLSSSLSNHDDLVMDGFAGTGTVLLESIVHKYNPRNCYGIEINPLARLIAKVKTTPLNINHLEETAKALYSNIAKKHKAPIPEFENIDFWFRKAVQRDLARILYCIEHLDASSDEQDFFRVCFSAIIRDMSWADPDIAPPVLLKPEKFPESLQQSAYAILNRKRLAKALTLFKSKVSSNMRRMKDFTETISQLPKAKSQIVWDDAREIKLGKYIEAGKIDKSHAKPLKNQVGMIITSPPYIAAQKYIRTTKLELLWLGLTSENETRQLDRSSIGTEKVTPEEKAEFVLTENATADKLLKRIHHINPERTAIASRYFRDMRKSIKAFHQALKPKGVCVLVVGNNTINDSVIANHKILSEIASENNMFSTELILKDPIRSYGMITKRHETAGVVIGNEYVVILRKQATSKKNALIG